MALLFSLFILFHLPSGRQPGSRIFTEAQVDMALDSLYFGIFLGFQNGCCSIKVIMVGVLGGEGEESALGMLSKAVK